MCTHVSSKSNIVFAFTWQYPLLAYNLRQKWTRWLSNAIAIFSIIRSEAVEDEINYSMKKCGKNYASHTIWNATVSLTSIPYAATYIWRNIQSILFTIRRICRIWGSVSRSCVGIRIHRVEDDWMVEHYQVYSGCFTCVNLPVFCSCHYDEIDIANVNI